MTCEPQRPKVGAWTFLLLQGLKVVVVSGVMGVVGVVVVRTVKAKVNAGEPTVKSTYLDNAWNALRLFKLG